MKRSLLRSVFMLILVIATSCKNGNDIDFERTEIIINNQKFEVLTAWKIFDDYIENKPDYEKNIIQKIEEEFDNKNAEFPFLLDAIKNKIKPDNELKREIELMKDVDFVGIVDSVFQIVSKKLPGPDTKILFLPANPANREFYRKFGIGFHAFTLGTGKIIVSFDPAFENWKNHIYYALAHEYHHSVWISRNFKTADLTPLEYMILEGKADVFAKEIFPTSNNPFWDILEDENEKRIWKLIKPVMNQRNSKTNDRIYYGTHDIPFGSVYAIGYHILKSFRKNNPEIDDAELIDIPPQEVLYLSNYDE